MKELMEIETLLLLMDEDFKFYRLQLNKSSGNDQNLSVIPNGDESSM